MTVQERIARHTAYGGEDDCWLWTGYSRANNPGNVVEWRDGIAVAHSPRRVIYADANGPIPDRHNVVMACGVGLCLNPRHMLLVTTGSQPRSRRAARLCYSGARLRKVRMDRGETQAHLAALCGVRPDVVRRWERGSEPSATHLLRIIGLFRCTVFDLSEEAIHDKLDNEILTNPNPPDRPD